MSTDSPINDRPLGRRIAAAYSDNAPSREPERLLDSILTTTGSMRPRPRWLALIKEPPMRLHPTVAVGSPTARVSFILVATLLLAVLASGAVLAGATLLADTDPLTEPSGHNGRIAFDSADGNIYVAEPDGSDPRILVHRREIVDRGPGEGDLRRPSWSPDGTRLAYYEMVETSLQDFGNRALVHVVSADGTGDIELTGGQPISPTFLSPSLVSASGLVWSPDSSQIAVSVLGDGETELDLASGTTVLPSIRTAILIAQADGSGMDRLPVEVDATDPMWSPDGGLIAFRGYQGTDDGSAGVRVTGPDGSELRHVVGGGTDRHGLYTFDEAFASPQWSPAGDQLLYFSWDGATYGTPDQDDYHVSVVAADGTDPHIVLDDPADELWPSWSPDGGRIAFQRHTADASYLELHVMNADGSDPRQLDVGSRMDGDGSPIWSPDGSAILTLTYGEPSVTGAKVARATIASLDPNVPTVYIEDPAGAGNAQYQTWPGFSWQRLP